MLVVLVLIVIGLSYIIVKDNLVMSDGDSDKDVNSVVDKTDNNFVNNDSVSVDYDKLGYDDTNGIEIVTKRISDSYNIMVLTNKKILHYYGSNLVAFGSDSGWRTIKLDNVKNVVFVTKEVNSTTYVNLYYALTEDGSLYTITEDSLVADSPKIEKVNEYTDVRILDEFSLWRNVVTGTCSGAYVVTGAGETQVLSKVCH